MTTTLSTVGYGDYKGFIDDSGNWTTEMFYLTFITIVGIVLRSVLTEEIFQYNKLMTVEEIVKKKMTDMEVYLYAISNVMKKKTLSLVMIENCKKLMEESVKNSTRFYFEENYFYQELPPNLKLKLIRSVLYRELQTFEFFFEDFSGKNRASTAFMVAIMQNLDSALYKQGEVIIEN